MITFNNRFKPGHTYVQIDQSEKWHLVAFIHPTRKWVKIAGFEGLFQRKHIIRFTNGIRPA